MFHGHRFDNSVVQAQFSVNYDHLAKTLMEGSWGPFSTDTYANETEATILIESTVENVERHILNICGSRETSLKYISICEKNKVKSPVYSSIPSTNAYAILLAIILIRGDIGDREANRLIASLFCPRVVDSGAIIQRYMETHYFLPAYWKQLLVAAGFDQREEGTYFTDTHTDILIDNAKMKLGEDLYRKRTKVYNMRMLAANRKWIERTGWSETSNK